MFVEKLACFAFRMSCDLKRALLSIYDRARCVLKLDGFITFLGHMTFKFSSNLAPDLEQRVARKRASKPLEP